MRRSSVPEIMDNPDLPEEVIERVYRTLTRTHYFLGNTRAILDAVRSDPLPVRRVMDIGCGAGGLLVHIRKSLRTDVIGVDLRPPLRDSPVPIVQADAVRDRLPRSDIAIAVCVAHHLSEADLVGLIRNVGKSCRRFILLDLVRHRLPLILFRLAVSPWVNTINARDGDQSIRRSFTPDELSGLVRRALAGSGAHFGHSVAPLYMRQIVDISY